ncbi:hypothetical protein H4R22_003231 [Coemansia sp. RSA 1290]|nr:hypothetical protein H4R22_003231 [Coemansia sp. RSA 1290]
MENEVLPKYFQTDKFTSFARQHYIYGFSKLTDGRKDKSLKGITKLQNKFFQKDRPELLGLIKRRQTTAKKVIEPSERKSRTERIRQRSLGKQKPTLQSAQTSTSIPFLTPAPSSTVAIFSAEPAPPMEASAMGNNASAPANDTSLQAMVQENIAKAHMSSQLDQACKALKVLNNVYELLDLEDLTFVLRELRNTHTAMEKQARAKSISAPAFNFAGEPTTELSSPMGRLCMRDASVPFTPQSAASTSMVPNTSILPESLTPCCSKTPLISNAAAAKPHIAAFSLSMIAENAHIPYLAPQPCFTAPTQQSAFGAISGTEMYTVAPTSAPILGTSPSMGSSSGSPHHPMMPVAATPATPVIGDTTILYPPSTERLDLQVNMPAPLPPPLNIANLGMFNPMPFGPAATTPNTMHMDSSNGGAAVTNFHFNLPQNQQAGAHLRAISSPSNVFYGNLQSPF